ALAGAGAESFNADGIHDLGFVSNETKAALLAHTRVLVQPSRNESFSRTIMEAWSLDRPVIAHRECLATAMAVERAGGGWLAGDEEEWAQLFARIAAASDEELAALGARGRAYADEHADWNKTVTCYEKVLDLAAQANETASAPFTSRATKPHAIHQ